MGLTLKNANIFKNGAFIKGEFNLDIPNADRFIGDICRFDNCFIFPAFCDVHVHLREPGFFYKESINTGTLAAAAGGYSDVFTMPNLNPVPDSTENLKVQLKAIEESAVINVHPFAAITKGEKGGALSDFGELAPLCIGFSDDGKGVQNDEIMLAAMEKAKETGKIISAHCEDESLLNGGCIHDGEFAAKNGFKGISSASEYKAIERDLKLAEKTGCKYHVCHVSAKESVELIRDAKKRGIDVTCETAPHYLLLNDSKLQDEGRFKMNPPVRSEADRQALIEGILDGTVDMIATDHAPHSAEEKSGGLKNSLMGVVGLETAFPVLYTYLVKTNIITLTKLIELMGINPRRRFGLPETEDICIYDLNADYTIEPEKFYSKGRSTPFAGMRVNAQNLITVCGGKAVWQNIIKN